jgi:SAM-dependent methyltransferase
VDPWWKPLYGDLLAELLLERSDVADTIAFLVRELCLAPGARVLDQCCGIGSLALPLAARGFSVVGVDQSERYVERAKEDAARAGLEVELVHADACAFVPSAPVDAAFNWWTSFGYAPDDDANLEMLRRAFDALAPGGAFALDFMNVPGVYRGLQRSVVTRKAEIVLVRESELDLARGAINKRWTYFLPSGERVIHDSAVRLYQPHDLGAMLTRAGFEGVSFFGDVRGEQLELDSPRCIAVARRPG